nr:MAG TPA: hypothetical protein [Bacteriophage sp.]
MVLPFKASGIGIFTVLRPVLLPKLIPVLVVFIVLVNLPFTEEVIADGRRLKGKNKSIKKSMV